ncbi:hypothetical protein ABZ801_01265 [Actinomadura sp. NPDC047616]|uniref:hypothetical protein n=1 Tax=Actinomadura sp. NPDC047616 TaxID=3155914 RepID=UPI003405E171
MTPIQELSLRVAVLAALANKIAEADEDTRKALMTSLVGVGADRAAAVLPDGTKVASVALVGGAAVAKVVDEDAFLTHVKATRPDEVIEVVRPSYRKALLAQAAKNGEEIPGVQLRHGTPYLRNSFVKDGQAAIAAAWIDGQLSLPELLELPAPPGALGVDEEP